MTPSKKASGHDSPPEGYPKDRDQYADPANYKYPIDTPEHVSAAWDYIHVAKNRREYNLAELAYMERRIKSAARRLGVTLGGEACDFVGVSRIRVSTKFREAVFEIADFELCCQAHSVS